MIYVALVEVDWKNYAPTHTAYEVEAETLEDAAVKGETECTGGYLRDFMQNEYYRVRTIYVYGPYVKAEEV